MLRGADGDFKVSTAFRFYDGSEAQAADPLIASIEGIENTPAYRGVALAVFETLELAEYGNRIPFLTFELIGDDAAPTLGAILADASAGAIQSSATRTVVGYAAYGSSIRAAVAPLIESHALALFDDGMLMRESASGARTVVDRDLGCSADGEGIMPRIEREMIQARVLPATVRLSYYDPAREFQTSEARASASEDAGKEERRELAAALEAGRAKSLAHQLVARSWAERERLTVRLPPVFLGIEPGTQMVLPISPAQWRVTRQSVEGLALITELTAWWAPEPDLSADPGRSLPSPDIVGAPASVMLVEAASPAGVSSGEAALLIAASSPTLAWRSRSVRVSGANREFLTSTAGRKAVMGVAETALADGQPFVRDDVASMTVGLIDPDQWLESCDLAALGAGMNLAVIGDETIQFGLAEPLGGGRFRLSQLLRGRGGSEWAAALHQAGEPFVLLDPGTLTQLDLPQAMIGADFTATLDGVDGGSASPHRLRGDARRPLSPAHLNATLTAGGDLLISWVRRCHAGLAWLDDVDAPLDERHEDYAITIAGTATTVAFEASTPGLTVPAATVASLGSGGASIAVRQIGEFGASYPAQLTVSLP